MSTGPRLPLSLCYQCGAKLDDFTPMDEGGAPEPGCIGICTDCGALHIFDDDLTQRRPTADEMAQIEKYMEEYPEFGAQVRSAPAILSAIRSKWN